MKICFVVRALPVHRLGGLEHHVRDLAFALNERGHEIFIVTTSGGRGDDLGVNGRGLSIYEIPGSKAGDYSLGFFRKAGRIVRRLHDERRFDFVVPIDFAGMFLGTDRFDVPVVPLIHGTMTSEVPLDRHHWRHLSVGDKARSLWRYKSRLFLRPFFRRMIKRAEALVVDSEYTMRELVWETGDSAVVEKTFVVPLGLDFSRYPNLPGSAAGGGAGRDDRKVFRIAMLGRLQRIKGVEIAIRVAEQLRLRGVDFELNIAGSGEFEEEARGLIQELDLTGNVWLRGRVDPNDMQEFLTSHDVFLFPDLTQPAFGLVAVEAMACGLPVVAARSGAIPEVVSAECGWLYDAWDVSGLAGLLHEISECREEVDLKREAALRRGRSFDAGKMGENMEKTLKMILGRGRLAE